MAAARIPGLNIGVSSKDHKAQRFNWEEIPFKHYFEFIQQLCIEGTGYNFEDLCSYIPLNPTLEDDLRGAWEAGTQPDDAIHDVYAEIFYYEKENAPIPEN